MQSKLKSFGACVAEAAIRSRRACPCERWWTGGYWQCEKIRCVSQTIYSIARHQPFRRQSPDTQFDMMLDANFMPLALTMFDSRALECRGLATTMLKGAGPGALEPIGGSN